MAEKIKSPFPMSFHDFNVLVNVRKLKMREANLYAGIYEQQDGTTIKVRFDIKENKVYLERGKLT
jgi:hypothetical protein